MAQIISIINTKTLQEVCGHYKKGEIDLNDCVIEKDKPLVIKYKSGYSFTHECVEEVVSSKYSEKIFIFTTRKMWTIKEANMFKGYEKGYGEEVIKKEFMRNKGERNMNDMKDALKTTEAELLKGTKNMVVFDDKYFKPGTAFKVTDKRKNKSYNALISICRCESLFLSKSDNYGCDTEIIEIKDFKYFDFVRLVPEV